MTVGGGNLPACNAWHPPPVTASDPGFWIIGCVQAAAGIQCSPTGTLGTTPSCALQNYNPNCMTSMWVLPTQELNATAQVGIYGCYGTQPDPRTFKCPNKNAQGIDVGGGLFTVLSIDEPCNPNAAPPPPTSAAAAPPPSTTSSTAKPAGPEVSQASKPKGKSAAPARSAANRLGLAMIALIWTASKSWY